MRSSRIRSLVACGLVSLAIACGSKSSAPAAAPAPQTTDAAVPTAAPGTQPSADAGADPCVAACLQRDMARAVSGDIIRKDCEQECSAAGPASE
jgi:hypothetical protein